MQSQSGKFDNDNEHDDDHDNENDDDGDDNLLRENAKSKWESVFESNWVTSSDEVGEPI